MSDEQKQHSESLNEMKGAAASFLDSLSSIERVLEGTVAQNIRIERKLERIVKFQYGLVFLTTLSLLAFVSLLTMIIKTGNQMQAIQEKQASLVSGLGEVKTTTEGARKEASEARKEAAKAPTVDIEVDEEEGSAVVVIRPQEEVKAAPPVSSGAKPQSPKPRPKAIKIPIDVAEAEELDE